MNGNHKFCRAYRKLEFHYVIFDEAHMLKNMATARCVQCIKIQCIVRNKSFHQKPQDFSLL